MKKKLVTLIDSVGRYIVGQLEAETPTSITLGTPVILSVQPDQQSGKLHIQTFPLFFKEFLTAGSSNSWTYQKGSVVIGGVELDERLEQQYNAIAFPQQASGLVGGEPTNSKVIKLFED